MKALVFVLALFASASAFAGNNKPAPKPKPVEAPTPFSELAAIWESAAPLKFDDIDGIYSGRCYERAGKSAMLPGLLVIQTYDAGPNFPKNSENYVTRYYHSDKYPAPDAFDLISTDDQKKKLFENIPRIGKTSSVAKEEEKSLTYSEFFDGTRTPATKAEYRVSNGLFIVRFNAVAGVVLTERVTAQRKEFNAGDVTEYCYFFKQIIPRADISKYR